MYILVTSMLLAQIVLSRHGNYVKSTVTDCVSGSLPALKLIDGGSPSISVHAIDTKTKSVGRYSIV